jgi:hypothetical protein
MGVGGVCASHAEGSLGTERTVNSLSLLLGRVRQNGPEDRSARTGKRERSPSWARRFLKRNKQYGMAYAPSWICSPRRRVQETGSDHHRIIRKEPRPRRGGAGPTWQSTCRSRRPRRRPLSFRRCPGRGCLLAFRIGGRTDSCPEARWAQAAQ